MFYVLLVGSNTLLYERVHVTFEASQPKIVTVGGLEDLISFRS